MAQGPVGVRRVVWLCTLLLLVIGLAIAWRAWKKPREIAAVPPVVAPAPPPPPPATQTRPTTTPEPKAARTFLDVVRAAYPGFATTQPLATPLDLPQAAHLVLHDPIYLSPGFRREMWITRADAPPTEQVLKDLVDPKQDEADAHVVRERPVFVHWMPNDGGVWTPYLVCADKRGGYQIISAEEGRRPLPTRRDYRWENAISWNDKIIVPSALGVSILDLTPAAHSSSFSQRRSDSGRSARADASRPLIESYHPLAPPDAAPASLASPRVVLAANGFLAWMPWDENKVGGRGAVRYAEPSGEDPTTRPTFGTWTDLLPDAGWPAKILHLVPLLDGSVLLIALDEHGATRIQFNTFEIATVKEELIAKLVDQLSDADESVRKAAYDSLSQYGQGIWSILEKLMDDQGPEAQARMRQLLKQKVQPTLNGLVLLGPKTLKLAARLSDSGAVFYAPAGVSIPNLNDPDAGPDYSVPAWIGIRPGHAIGLLPPGLTADLTPGKSKLDVAGNDWIAASDVRGPRRFVGNGFVSLLRKNEQAFSEFIGEDRRGRWLLRKPDHALPATTSTSTSTSAPATVRVDATPATLVIDPTLPDPTPRLPVWVFRTATEVGWDKAGWAVAKNVTAYALHEDDWVQVEESDPVSTKREQVPPQTEPAVPVLQSQPTIPASGAATRSATTSASTEPVENSDAPLLIDSDGNRYFGGLSNLLVVSRTGKRMDWPLPPIALGKGKPWLVRSKEGLLFLFNQGGRVLRIKPTPGGSEPFVLEKTFTHHVPNVDNPTRVWLDPAGRIVMAWDNQLAFFFPAGYVPTSIADKMLSDGDDEE